MLRRAKEAGIDIGVVAAPIGRAGGGTWRGCSPPSPSSGPKAVYGESLQAST